MSAQSTQKPVCAVVDVGPGNGAAFARRFAAEGYAVALLARTTSLTSRLAQELPLARAYACDAGDPATVSGPLKPSSLAFGKHAPLAGRGAFIDLLAPLRKIEWVVYSKRPFGGPEAVLAYLSRYTHRVAIANRRLVALDDTGVAFRGGA